MRRENIIRFQDLQERKPLDDYLKTIRKERRNQEQAGCRNYWAATYGAAAELASRGGVNWL